MPRVAIAGGNCRTALTWIGAAALIGLCLQTGAGVGCDTARAVDGDLAVGRLKLSEPKSYRLLVTIQVGGGQRDADNILCTAPVPVDWPEQQVKLLEERKPAGVTTRLRRIADKGEMLTVSIPHLARGGQITVERVYEVTRYTIRFAGAPADLRAPVKVRLEHREFVSSAPGIELNHPKLKELHAKLQTELKRPDAPAWDQVRSYFDWVRSHVQFQAGPYRGAAKTLQTRSGDCEDYTALFVALCRLSRIPARSVWIEGHAYAEFFLEDASGQGEWIPCELVGPVDQGGQGGFGVAADRRPILQKGDEFVDTLTGKTLRYMPQTLKATGGPVTFQSTRLIQAPPGRGEATR